MLSMAMGIKVGSGVRVLRGKFAAQNGVVQVLERVGRARKWIVKLNGGFFFFTSPKNSLNLPTLLADVVLKKDRTMVFSS